MSVTVGMRGVRLARWMCSALLVVACVPVVRAADVPAGQVIASRNACMGCHAVDRKLVGPAFQQIAAKYKGDGAARAKLARKVKDGGSGVWGVIPMPSHPSMSDADIRAVVDWVLAGAPAK